MAMVIDLRLFQTLWVFPYTLIFLTFRKEISKKNVNGISTKLHNIVIVEYATILILVSIGCLIAIIGGLNYFSIVNLSITEYWGSEFEYLMLIVILISFFEYVFFSLNKYLLKSSRSPY
ncbi:hypothetical protein [Cuniculiplasma divulgatum]|uniref:hypothetical protein n=1 Tax=Cuniculiplasma divulgatum TaxID=1673428 RepID=UPI0011AEA375|nr:hypothetical protein [Cuniculiplasma divulgatum]MCI2413269.1 hypothetical protein [Cuniculiplasma sp.]WMT48596.1 MAG: hypothetical protein RE472_05835 [Thermoplasmatales archaeon]